MIEVTERDSRSWPMWLLQSILKPIPPHVLLDSAKWGIGWKDIKGSAVLTVPPFGLNGCTVLPRVVEECNVYDFVPGPNAEKSQDKPKKIYFFAGGAFLAPAGPFHWTSCAMLATRIPNATLTLVSYPLTPHNSAPSSYAHLQKVLQVLLAESRDKGETAILVGDSAGANLVFGLPLASLKDDPKALLPAAIMGISPAVDFNHDHPQSRIIEPFDCMLSNDFCNNATSAWAGDWSFDDPRLSPIKADLKQFVDHGVQVHGVIGKYDVLAPNAEEYMKKCQAAGVSGKWLLWDRQMHDFALSAYFGFPESKSAMDFIVKTLTNV